VNTSIRDASNAQQVVVQDNVFVARVYWWMGIGLGITAGVSMLVAQSGELVQAIFGNPILLIVLFLAQLGMVVGIGVAARRASPALAASMFVAYAGMLGLTMSSIFLVYTSSSIASTFFVSGGMFGAMSLYGWTTKRDLTGIGSLCFMALIGIILASIVNIFVGSTALGWLITYAGVAIFVGLTAYDTQKIKRIGASVDSEGAVGRGLAIQGALALYLDFVNLFLFLLRLFGRRK